MEFHSHELSIKITLLSEEMIQDINNFPKSARVCDIIEALDKKYATEIDYMAVYNQVRNNFPRFGINDTNSFLQFLRE